MHQLSYRSAILLLGMVYSTVSHAALEDDMTEQFFSGNNPTLTAQEKKALAIADKWRSVSSDSFAPAPGADGSVTYLFGSQQPSIVCAVLQVCDIALQAGEKVNDIHLGDTVRWTVDPALTGSGPTETIHVIVKPHDVGLETSLIVATDRRTYHFQLRSHRTQYMPQVNFSYPEDSQAKWDAIKSHKQQVMQQAMHEKAEKTLPETGENIGNLDFDYDISGDASWKPVRVYNDGTKTTIQMPTEMSQTEAPTLLVIRENRNPLSDDEAVLVNYRVQADKNNPKSSRYIVDAVFDKAILIAGVGWSQDKVTIERRKQ